MFEEVWEQRAGATIQSATTDTEDSLDTKAKAWNLRISEVVLYQSQSGSDREYG